MALNINIAVQKSGRWYKQQ